MARLSSMVSVAELAVIVLLFWALSREYQANVYMQLWVGDNGWVLGYLLNGYVATLLSGLLIAWSLAMFLGDKWEERLSRKRKNLA